MRCCFQYPFIFGIGTLLSTIQRHFFRRSVNDLNKLDFIMRVHLVSEAPSCSKEFAQLKEFQLKKILSGFHLVDLY